MSLDEATLRAVQRWAAEHKSGDAERVEVAAIVDALRADAVRDGRVFLRVHEGPLEGGGRGGGPPPDGV